MRNPPFRIDFHLENGKAITLDAWKVQDEKHLVSQISTNPDVRQDFPDQLGESQGRVMVPELRD